MLSFTFINSYSPVSHPVPDGPLVGIVFNFDNNCDGYTCKSIEGVTYKSNCFPLLLFVLSTMIKFYRQNLVISISTHIL